MSGYAAAVENLRAPLFAGGSPFVDDYTVHFGGGGFIPPDRTTDPQAPVMWVEWLVDTDTSDYLAASGNGYKQIDATITLRIYVELAAEDPEYHAQLAIDKAITAYKDAAAVANLSYHVARARPELIGADGEWYRFDLDLPFTRWAANA